MSLEPDIGSILDPFLRPPQKAGLIRRLLQRARRWTKHLILGPASDLDRVLAGLLRDEVDHRRQLQQEFSQLREESRRFFETRTPQIEALEESKQVLTAQTATAVEAIEKNIQAIGKLRESLDIQVSRIQSELDRLSARHKATDTHIQDLSRDSSEFQNQLAMLQTDHDEFKEKLRRHITEMTQENGVVRSQLADATTSLENQWKRTEELQLDYDEFKTQLGLQVQSLEAFKKTATGQVETAVSAFEEVRAHLEELQHDHDQLKEILPTRIEDNREKTSVLSSQLAAVIETLENYRSHVEETQIDHDEFKESISPQVEALEQEKIVRRRAVQGIEAELQKIKLRSEKAQEDFNAWKSSLTTEIKEITGVLTELRGDEGGHDQVSNKILEQLLLRIDALELDLRHIADLLSRETESR